MMVFLFSLLLASALGFSTIPEPTTTPDKPSPLVDFAPYGICDTSPDGLSWLPAPQTCITHGGLSRCWYTYAPISTSTSLAKVPLVIALHGTYGCASLPAMGWGSKAEENGFIVVWPQSTAHRPPFGPPMERTEWNDGGAYTEAEKAGIDDLGFIRSLIERMLLVDGRIDANRVYLTGHSNGAVMAQRVALQSSGLVAAVVAFGGAPAPADPTWPGGEPVNSFVATPVMNVVGTLDGVNNFSAPFGPLPGAVRSLELWAIVNKCSEAAAVVQPEALHVRHTYCAGGPAEAVLIEVPGAGHHAFPPGSGTFAVSLTDRIEVCAFRGYPFFYEPDCRYFVELDSVHIAWDFLQRFSLQAR